MNRLKYDYVFIEWKCVKKMENFQQQQNEEGSWLKGIL